MKRISFISSLISNCETVIDVGSDHAYLAIELLKNNKAKKVINVEVNKKPLEQGVKNLQKYNLLSRTENILNNGLKNLETKLKETYFDYLTISGMGAKNIVDILTDNKLNFKYLILQPNNNEFILRKWLIKNHYQIIKECLVYQKSIYYPIIMATKSNRLQYYSKISLYFGKLNNVENKKLQYDYVCSLRDHFSKYKNSKQMKQKFRLANKMVKKYENKWNIQLLK